VNQKFNISFLLLLCVFTTKGQQLTDTAFIADARRQAINFYTEAIGIQSRLFNGSEYLEHIVSRNEYAYMHEDVEYGNVKYAGELYTNVPLYYDLETDQLVTAFPHGKKIQLLRSQVEYFEIDGHKFVLLDNKKMANGFYDLLYDGKMKFYAQRQKVLVMKVDSNGGNAHNIFESSVKYFILKDGAYHAVKTRRSVLALMSDHRKEIKRALKAANVRYKNEREKAIALLLNNYERIGDR
jgi:hypothetical protein